MHFPSPHDLHPRRDPLGYANIEKPDTESHDRHIERFKEGIGHNHGGMIPVLMNSRGTVVVVLSKYDTGRARDCVFGRPFQCLADAAQPLSKPRRQDAGYHQRETPKPV